MKLPIPKFVLVAALSTTCGLSALSGICQASTSHHTKRAGTVPMDLRDNRVFVNLTAVRPNGTTRKVRFIVDTGGGAVILSESLVRDLGLKKIAGPTKKEEGATFQPIKPPEIQIAGMPLDFSGVPVFAVVDLKNGVLPGLGAEGFLPGRVLKKYDVTFDYPAKTFTMARFGAQKHRGTAVHSPIQANSGFPRIEIKVDGQKYGFLLDTGAAYSMVSQKLIDKWMTDHPMWPHSTGAVGPANMGGALDKNATLLRIPVLQWGSFHLYKVGVVSRPAGTFETYMSSMMTGPIIGSLAGNVLRRFRVEIDYAHGTTYLEKDVHLNAHDLDTAGIVVRAMPGGEYKISGVARKEGKPLVKGVERGDTLLRVDNLDCAGASLADVLRALRGKPGQSKSLVLERNGRQLRVNARVVRLP